MRNRSGLVIPLACCALAASMGAGAVTPVDCASVSNNLVANCGFESGAPPPSGSNAWGTLTIDASSPHAGSFSLRGVSQVLSNVPRVYANSNCFSVVPGRTYQFGGWTRMLATTTTAVMCGAYVVAFDSPNCASGFTTQASAGMPFPAPSGWAPFSGRTTSQSWQSAYLQLTCFGGTPSDSFTASFDDAYFADWVFADGFE